MGGGYTGRTFGEVSGVREKRLLALIEGFGLWPAVVGDAAVTDVVIDPAQVTPGALFVARRGWYYDTHTALREVLERGAAALIVSKAEAVPAGCRAPCWLTSSDDPLLGLLSARFFEHPTAHLKVFGVTGTNGKTTCAHLIAHMLRARGERVAVMGTVGYDLGDGQVRAATNTTPDGVVIQRFARAALDGGATALVMEVSSHGLAIGRVAGVVFDAVGFTNLSHDHLDFHKTWGAYREAKGRLFSERLEASLADGKRPVAVANIDGDGEGWAMLAQAPAGVERVSVSAVGVQGAAWGIALARHDLTGMGGEVRALPAQRRVATFNAPLVGAYNVENILVSALMVAAQEAQRRQPLDGDGSSQRLVDEALAQALGALDGFGGVPGRMQRAFTPREDEPLVFVDHAHTPDAVSRALQMAKSLQGQPVTVVLGCGGDRDPSKRAPMAAAACAFADFVYLTSDNPRSESSFVILAAMTQGVPPEALSRVHVIEDRAAAVEAAIRHALTHGLGPVLLLGKGHEDYQEVGGVKRPFSDLTCAQGVIARVRAERMKP
jgi:UDP-N-acetylmuramyl-tripeptide synthetase